jgi:lipopolysaccharide/colanic/teichoic acid biosynthesis glycosyltransferase
MKRLLDIVFALAGLVLLAPVILVIAITVAIRLGNPVLFKQLRPGKHEKIFAMVKFRTMTDERSASGELLPSAQRLTNFGRFLRRTSLDELPELWNILIGDMSLVGPRPLLIDYLPHYNERQRKRHDVQPGLTGWAQINGRNTLSWEEKFELDVWYVENQNMMLDISILFKTALLVAAQKNTAPTNAEISQRFDKGKDSMR